MEKKQIISHLNFKNVMIKILAIALTALLLSVFLSIEASADVPRHISNCITINSPGTYILNTNIISSKNNACINIASNNVILDGNGFTTTGSGNGIGVYFNDRKGVTIKNLKIRNFHKGIQIDNSKNNILINNTFKSNNIGIYFQKSKDNKIINNSVNSNKQNGIYLEESKNNEISSNDFSLNLGYGIYLEESKNNNIFNNIFNNTNNFRIEDSINQWNITKTLGTNIVGGLYSGGNVWLNQKGKGFSQTCADENEDGICDSKYTLAYKNIDLLPLAYKLYIPDANTPGTPTNLAAATSSFWINHTWSSGVNTNSFNVSVNGNWDNSSNALFRNTSSISHGWVNISVAGYNATSNLLSGFISQDTRILNNPIQITDISDSYSLNEGQTLTIDANYTDTDSDTGNFARNFSKGTFDTSSGILSWTIGAGNAGVYNWQINVIDGYGSVSTKMFTVTVISNTPGTPTNLDNTTGAFWVNHTWSSGVNTDSFNVSVNGNWLNSSNVLFRNTSSISHGRVNISVAGYNATSNLLSGFISQDTRILNNPIQITDISDSYSLNEGQTLTVDANYTDTDSDTGTFARNFSKGTFDTSTGILSWTTGAGDAGVYSWQINVSDGYGSISTKMFTVTVISNTPGTPTNLAAAKSSFWVNHTWSSGVNTDSFNVSVNGNWDNSSNAFFRNTSSISHGWVNISVAGYNATSNLLSGFISLDTRILNNPIQITDISDSYSLNEGQTLTIDANYTDTDSDIGTFARNFSKGTFDTSSGILSWTIGAGNAGVYNWQINVIDGYGSVSTKMFTVTVISNTPGTPTNLDNTTGAFWVNHTWSSGVNTDSFNVSVNGNWLNSSNALFRNTSSISHGWVNISVAGYNATSNLLSGFISQDTRILNNPIQITDISDSYSLNEGQTLTIDANYTDLDSDTGTFARNFSKGTFDTSTGILSWTIGAGDAGFYIWQINVTDGYGSISTKEFTVIVAAASASPPKITSFAPSSPVSNDQGVARLFNITANQTVNVIWYINGIEVFNQNDVTESSYTNTTATPGTWNVNASVHNSNGTDSKEWVWVVTSSDLPPDPVTVAPPVDTTVATDIATSTSFLYTGSDPIQTGVAPDTIEARRVAVLRGRVLTREGTNLSGVNITILSHPEFGSTMSRVDGMFDMAVNGGGLITVNYEKEGYLTVQRQAQTPWQDYEWLPDVVMIQADPVVTTIDLSSTEPIQVAQGSVITDSDGTRQATLLFTQGVQANMMLPDGTTVPLTSMHVRATEYTVGENGPEAMPAQLPPTSGYTYAVDLTVDEVMTHGATDVRFDRPVYFYVENFLNFPVGGIVPVGYYNRSLGLWIPSENGRIIKILSITEGMADIDVDGSGTAANAAALSELSITDAERQQLAVLYQPELTLWRVPIMHFTPWDCNWPVGPAPGATSPNQLTPDQNSPQVNKPNIQCGSIIGCQDQVLGEAVEIAGTPFSLHYQSDRVPGRKEAYTLNIPLSGASVPESLRSINLEVSVAGRSFSYSFPAAPNQIQTFTWDRKDAYDRILQGIQPVTTRISYVYGAVYQKPAELRKSFGALSGIPISGDMSRQEITLWQEWQGSIGVLDNMNQGLGSWSLNVHHAYDTSGSVLYLGDGRKRSAQSLNNVITTVAGTGNGVFNGDGGQATQATVSPWAIAIGADGSIYIVGSSYRVRRIGTDGIINTVAGDGVPGVYGFEGEGGLATEAHLSDPNGIAIGGDGSIYIVDKFRILRIGTDGIINTVAGNGGYGFNGDGGPATEAQLYYPKGVAIAADGSIYIADTFNNRVRRIGTDGIINTVAGGGILLGFSGDGGPATQAQLDTPWGITIGGDGSVYISEIGTASVRRIGTDGIINTVAGNGSLWGSSGDGGPATQAQLNFPQGVAIEGDGSVYIADRYNSRVRRVGPDGIINTVAGTGKQGVYGFSGDGGSASLAKLSFPTDIAIGADGNIYIADSGNRRVRRIAPSLPGISNLDFLIPSDDGNELYLFNRAGRHLRTLDALTGAVRYNFTYDSAGNLNAITDSDGNVVSIERDATGIATAIVSPFGQRIDLTLESYLVGITNPEGEKSRFSYTDDGLLTSMTDPRNNIYHFSYDELGRLIKDEDPAGGSKTLSRSDMLLPEKSGSGYSVKLSTGLNRNTTYSVLRLPTGDQRLTNIFPDSLTKVTLVGTNGTQTVTYPDGTRITQVQGPDPRFGMQAPVTKNMTITSPGKLNQNITNERTASLADPSDPLSLKTLTDKTSINGRTFTSTFDAAARNVTSQTPLGRKTVTILDNKGRVTESQIPGIIPVQYSYDSRGRLGSITQGTRNYAFSYDADGNLASTTDPMLLTAGFEYDAAGRVTRQTLPDGRHIQYTYDANGNVISITPPGRPDHNFTYTPVDLIEEYLPPDVGVPNQTRYTYNIDRDLIMVTRPDGATIDLGYDSAGRLSTTTYPQGSTSLAYNLTSGKLKTITSPDGGTITYAYDGSLLTDTSWSGAITGSIHRTYDNNFWVTSENVNSANNVNFQYDQDGLLTQAGGIALSRDSQNGMLTGTGLGSVTDALSYSSFGEVAEYQAAYGGAGIFSVNYARDDIGRIVSKNETIDGAVHIYNYSYDLAGRLTNVSKDDVPVSQYVYDANGNRLSYTGASGTISGIYDDQDRLMQYGAATYTYTANGELLSKTNGSEISSFDYDVLGNLLNVSLPDSTKIEYIMDGQNRRIGKKVNGVLVQGFLYENQLKPIAELDGAGNVVSRFVYASRGNVPDYMVRGGNTYRIITDHLGSPRLVIDVATGAVMQKMDYDEFGNVILDSNPGFQTFGFAGGIYDSDTQLVRFGARDYDAEVGRWAQKDPIGFRGGDMNLYGYVLNDPINLVDPSGFAWFRLEGEPYVVGRDGHWLVPTGGIIGRFIEDWVPAGHTFGMLHDALVDKGCKAGLPDWLINIPTMGWMYEFAVYKESYNSLTQLLGGVIRDVVLTNGGYLNRF